MSDCPGEGRVSDWRFIRELNMAYKITDSCTSCGSCVDSCPADAISEGETQYVIDPDTCIDCGSCVDACPVGAIIEGD